jgi:hypothetical protein
VDVKPRVKLTAIYYPETEADAIKMITELFDFANKGIHSVEMKYVLSKDE